MSPDVSLRFFAHAPTVSSGFPNAVLWRTLQLGIPSPRRDLALAVALSMKRLCARPVSQGEAPLDRFRDRNPVWGRIALFLPWYRPRFS